MRSQHLHPLILGQLLFFGGCAELEWVKPNAEAVAIKQDLEVCQQVARLQATSLSRDAVAAPKVEVDSFGRPVFGFQPADQSERRLREHDFTNSCMKEKGYRLAPVRADGRH